MIKIMIIIMMMMMMMMIIIIIMWKLLTGIISEDMYCFMENENLLPEEQKGCRRKSRGTKDQLLIDKTILKDCRKRRTNLAMAWINYSL